MKTMKLNLLTLFAISLLFTTSCKKDNDLNNDGEPDYSELCGDFDGGDFNVSIDGQDWSTSCVQAVYTETITVDYEQKFLYVYAYNYDGVYFSDTDIEVAYVIWIETTVGDETTISKGAVFYRGFYDYSQLLNNPDYEVEDLVVYSSDEDSMDDIINITDLNSNTVTGNINFKLFEEDTNAEVTMSGSFMANIVE
jgi:hypothetical protein